jgi:hypothetical protein
MLLAMVRSFRSRLILLLALIERRGEGFLAEGQLLTARL